MAGGLDRPCLGWPKQAKTHPILARPDSTQSSRREERNVDLEDPQAPALTCSPAKSRSSNASSFSRASGSPAADGCSRRSATDAAPALDVGCGVLGWLRILSEWVGPDGEVTGTDVDDAMLSAADRFVTEEGLRNVGFVKDDLFASELEPNSFDLVRRYEITPSGGHRAD